jgi:hypothetical protein
MYPASNMCVFHELTECTKNPKFKYRLQNILDDKKQEGKKIN